MTHQYAKNASCPPQKSSASLSYLLNIWSLKTSHKDIFFEMFLRRFKDVTKKTFFEMYFRRLKGVTKNAISFEMFLRGL